MMAPADEDDVDYDSGQMQEVVRKARAPRQQAPKPQEHEEQEEDEEEPTQRSQFGMGDLYKSHMKAYDNISNGYLWM
jgi:hypothetical protein